MDSLSRISRTLFSLASMIEISSRALFSQILVLPSFLTAVRLRISLLFFKHFKHLSYVYQEKACPAKLICQTYVL